MIPEIIYCAAGNSRFADIARQAGWLYGAQLPNTVYGLLHFADQDWKAPDRARYMAALAEHRPYMATVLDWEYPEQFDEVIDWAEQAAQYVQEVIIIPKVVGRVQDVPESIGGKPVRLGYSVPTRYGGTRVPVSEFANRPVHLLGGSPQLQMKLAMGEAVPAGQLMLPTFPRLNVVSVDGNYAQKMAVRYCQFWRPGDAGYAKNRWWPMLKESEGQKWNNGGDGAPYEAFRRSCKNIMAAWKALQ